MSLAVWVVKPTEKIKEKRMEKMLKKACEQKTCQARFAQRCKQTSRASAPSCVCSRLAGGCCCCFVRPPAELSTPPLERASRLAQKRLAAGTGL
jgi:hypothetical protein